MKFHDVPGFLRGVRLSMGLRRVVPVTPEAPPAPRFQQAPLVREPLPVELDGETLGYILKVRASWTALCLDRRPLSGVEHRGKHWAISEVCCAAMPTGFSLISDLGAATPTHGPEATLLDVPRGQGVRYPAGGRPPSP
jgi:hypothetical protein